MIYYVTGPLGAGKSYYGARKVCEAFLKGKVVITNMELRDNWEKIILRHAPHYLLASKPNKRYYEKEMRERYAFTTDISLIVHGLIHGYGQNRGVRLIDEAHNEINNREWAEANQKELLQIMALSRKRGWDDYIIAQHKDNTDAALRRIAAIEIRLVDWQQITKLPIFQTQLLPFHLFLAQAFPTNISSKVRKASTVLYRELFLLGWQSKIYNTFQDFSGLDFGSEEFWRHSPIKLPVPGGFDHLTYEAARALDQMIWGWHRAQKTAAAEAAAVSARIVAGITRRPEREREPLPSPSAESRTSSRPPLPTSGNGASRRTETRSSE